MDFITLQQAVAFRLNRPDLLSPIPPFLFTPSSFYVLDRIGYYQSSLFSPSEQLDYSITCVPGQTIYTLPPGMENVVHLRVLVGSVWLPMYRVDRYEQILNSDLVQPAITSIPFWWATRGNTLRLYLTPNASYPLELMSNTSPPAPVGDNEVTYWSDEQFGAGTLIQNATCAEICRTLLNDDARATQFTWTQEREDRKLKNRTSRLDGPLWIAPYL